MNRRFEFRIWDGLKMEYSILVGELGIFYTKGMSEKDTACISEFNTKIENAKCMQFTGLIDKNGVQIYEGDIVYVTPYGTDIYKGQKFEVYYSEDKARFMFKTDGKRPVDRANFDSDGVAKFEVIGNIFQNT